jgi:hypothetical protein
MNITATPLPEKQQGFILITVLLFVTALTLTASMLINNSLLASKMGNYYAQTKMALYQAESTLSAAEIKILNAKTAAPTDQIPLNQQLSAPTARFKKVASYCGVDYYRGAVTGHYKNASITLQSTIAKVDEEAHCKDPPKVKSGRQSWRILDIE